MLCLSLSPVQGSKSLEKNIIPIAKMAQNIDHKFKEDCKKLLTGIIQPENIDLGSQAFKVTMCNVTHNDFFHSQTKLPQYSKYLKAKQLVFGELDFLNNLLRMLINNKKHGRTMIKNLKKTKKLVLADSSCRSEINLLIQQQIYQIRQHCCKVTRDLCKQANTIILIVQTDILTYKQEAKNTINEIIHHAMLCHKYIAKCCHLACIEHCVSEWWMQTKRQKGDYSRYYVTAVERNKASEFNASTEETFALVSGWCDPPQILIQVRSEERSFDGNYPIVFSDYLNEELIREIITDDAVCAFKEGMKSKIYEKRYGMISALHYAAK
jgi:hypothetical protein